MQSSPQFDALTEISDAPIGVFHYKMMILVLLITLFDGYDTFIPAYVIHYVVGPWHVAHKDIALLVTSGLFGFLLGSLASGFIADRIGRKPTLIGALYVAGVFSIATGLFAHTFSSFIVLRVLTGLGLGVLMPVGTVYINELAPRRFSNIISVTGPIGFAIGGIAASIIAAFVTPMMGWPILFFIAGLALVLAVVLHRFFDESPRFLITRRADKSDQIRRLMTEIRPDQGSAYVNAKFSLTEQPESGIGVLFLKKYRRATIAIWIAAFFTLFEIYALAGWLPELMIYRGFGLAGSFLFGAILQGSGIVGAYLLGAVADFAIGRKWTVIGAFICAAVVSLILTNTSSQTANMLLVTLLGVSVVGGQFILNNFTANTYDTAVRGTGQGMQLAVGRIGGLLGPYVAGLLGSLKQNQTSFYIAIAVAAFCVSVSFLFVRDLPAQANLELP